MRGMLLEPIFVVFQPRDCDQQLDSCQQKAASGTPFVGLPARMAKKWPLPQTSPLASWPKQTTSKRKEWNSTDLGMLTIWVSHFDMTRLGTSGNPRGKLLHKLSPLFTIHLGYRNTGMQTVHPNRGRRISLCTSIGRFR